MKRLISIVLLLIIGLAAGVILDRYLSTNTDETAIQHAEKHTNPNYICPMHSEIISNEQGSCPICGMDLVEIKTSESNIDDSGDEYPTVRVSSTMINNMGVRVAQVERTTLIRQIETPGFIQRVVPESITRYNAPAKGRVAKFHFKQGQWFEQSNPLIDIALDDLVLVQEKHLALLVEETAQKKNKEAKSNEAKSNKTRPMADSIDTSANDTATEKLNETLNEKLNEEPLTESTEAVTDRVVTEKKPAELTTKKTRLLMKAAGMTEEQITKLEETKVTSPIITLYAKHAGEVSGLRVAVDEQVKAREMLFSLGGLMRVTVLANAFQRDASWVKPGQDVDIILPHDSNKPWKGKVNSGAVSININSQNIGVELVFNAPNSVVKSGMYVVGNIYGQVRDNTLSLPREAVIYSRNEKRVIVALGKGRFKPVVVETGISNDTEIEILEGLEEGDTVVVSAQFLIDSESSLQASYRRMTAVEQ